MSPTAEQSETRQKLSRPKYMEIQRHLLHQVSIGALTHSAACLNLALDWVPGDVAKS